jgi:hypothetical protein
MLEKAFFKEYLFKVQCKSDEYLGNVRPKYSAVEIFK